MTTMRSMPRRWRSRWCGFFRGTTRGSMGRFRRSPASSPAPTASWSTAIGIPDGLEGEEGAFSICTFWLAQALAMIGERERAERVFRRMLRHANHVGLYSEEIDPQTGEFLGNFPQAFTHIALINCAAALARTDGKG